MQWFDWSDHNFFTFGTKERFADRIAELYCQGRYDCERGYWDNIQSLYDDVIEKDRAEFISKFTEHKLKDLDWFKVYKAYYCYASEEELLPDNEPDNIFDLLGVDENGIMGIAYTEACSDNNNIYLWQVNYSFIKEQEWVEMDDNVIESTIENIPFDDFCKELENASFEGYMYHFGCDSLANELEENDQITWL